MADELENTPCALMGEAMARYKHDELTAGEAVSIILEQAKRLSHTPTDADTSLQKVQTTPPDMEAVAWLLTHPTEPRDCVLAYAWQEPITQADRDAGWDAQALAVIPTEGLGSSLRDTQPGKSNSSSSNDEVV